MAELELQGFDDLDGWNDEDHKAALAAFRHSASYLLQKPPKPRDASAASGDMVRLAKLALDLPDHYTEQQAKSFFENNFRPCSAKKSGLLTGYYEPEFAGSRQKNEDFSVPLHRRPIDLISISSLDAKEYGLSDETSFARKTSRGLTYHLSREEVMSGGLDDLGLEVVWLKDAIDAYIVHIQGSARILLDDGSVMRVVFDGKSGHPYRSIGKELIERGIFTRKSITMDKLCNWLRTHHEDGLSLMAENPSYIFLKESKDNFGNELNFGPKAAASIPLLPMRSLAVDRMRHTFGLPVWIETKLPGSDGPGSDGKEQDFKQLLFAHDTGSAIKGLARGDLFCGTGSDAGSLAGEMKQQARFTFLMPRQNSAEERQGR